MTSYVGKYKDFPLIRWRKMNMLPKSMCSRDSYLNADLKNSRISLIDMENYLVICLSLSVYWIGERD